jgi:hypothetical protein
VERLAEPHGLVDSVGASGSGGLRLYVDTTNIRAQAVYAALGMNGDHYCVFEDMFAEPPRMADIRA